MGKYKKPANILLFVVCVILGIMLATQFKSAEQARSTLSQQRAEDLVDRLKEAEKEKKALAEELKKLQSESTVDISAQERIALKSKAGEVALVGPGVKVTVDDSKVVAKPGDNANLYIIHDDDLLRLINELRAAGAEAISINDQRLLDVSEIRCAGPTVSVNNNRFTPPYVIAAIGDPKTLESALRLRGGVVDTLKFWGITVNVEKGEAITVPAYKGTRHFEYAKVKDGDKQ
ncbi:MAG: DUF881 domain-containing protein [Acidaminococcaceae bacterium]|jgi:uncharacterized protein YlxW (UPF0749 family)|nr:DUF881 domain-containing protein [Acidaminococcaceae bacterium]